MMEKKIMKIGVTGSAGSGKSLVCEAFARLGLETFDCDRIARDVVEPGKPAYREIVDAFGSGVLAEDRTLDRAVLRKMMVDDSGRRKQLEVIVHPRIVKEMVHRMQTAVYPKEPACAVEVPLLFELGLETHFDEVVVVTAPDGLLAERITVRDGVSLDNAQKMLALQMDQQKKTGRADHVIVNCGNKEELFQAVSILYGKLKRTLDKRGAML